MIELPELILASGSPRRTEILTSVGWKFIKHPADIDETELAGELPQDYVRRLAIEKAEVVAAEYPGSIVLGADTTVVIHARRMLSMLAGNWHEVLTGVAICESGETRSAVDSTRVKFAPMTDSEVEFLATMGEPMDKAGAYAVQAQAALFIEAIDGDYWNVVGLPVKTVYDLVMKKPGN